MKKFKLRTSGRDLVFLTFNTLFLVLFFLITLYPMIYVLSASLSDPDAVSSGRMVLWPVDFTLQGYKYIFKYQEIWTGYGNTIFYTVLGTIFALLITIPCAYGLSRRDLKGRGAVMAYFMITMYVSGGMIPGYLNIQSLGLVNTRLYMILSGGFSVYNMIVARTFFSNSIPWELHEAARIDGANDFTTFFRIVLPLAKPIMVVLMLYYGVAYWNSYFTAMMYLTDRAKFPLQLILKEILISSQISQASIEGLTVEEISQIFQQEKTANLLKYGVIVVSSLPMLIIYPFLQKFFAKGVMIGSVKG